MLELKPHRSLSKFFSFDFLDDKTHLASLDLSYCFPTQNSLCYFQLKASLLSDPAAIRRASKSEPLKCEIPNYDGHPSTRCKTEFPGWDSPIQVLTEKENQFKFVVNEMIINSPGESQSTQNPLPGTCVLMFCIRIATSFEFCVFGFKLSLPWSDLKISCSMMNTHSSRSSEFAASKCHCLLSKETM